MGVTVSICFDKRTVADVLQVACFCQLAILLHGAFLGSSLIISETLPAIALLSGSCAFK